MLYGLGVCLQSHAFLKLVLYQFRLHPNDIKSAIHRCAQSRIKLRTNNSRNFHFLTHSQQSTVNSQQAFRCNRNRYYLHKPILSIYPIALESHLTELQLLLVWHCLPSKKRRCCKIDRATRHSSLNRKLKK